MNSASFIAFGIFVCAICLAIIFVLYRYKRKRKMSWFPELIGTPVKGTVSEKVYSPAVVQPLSPHIAALPILGPIRLTDVQDRADDIPANPDQPKPPYSDMWMEVGMISIRNADGALVGSTADVIAELEAAQAAGEKISVEEATDRAFAKFELNSKNKDQ